MFPTAHKDKIPKTLSYPVKAKKISETFADVPQSEQLEIHFSNYWALNLKNKGRLCCLISVDYMRVESSNSNGSWQIRVQAVPTEMSHHVTELLEKEGFHKIHKWLHSKADLTGKIATADFEVIYNEDMDKLEYDQHFKQL
jgi:hypothetical protein